MSEGDTKHPPKQENMLLNIALNIVVPSLFWSKGDEVFGLEPSAVLVIALLFPIGYGIYDLVRRKKYNFFSVIGFFSLLITGSVGLLELDSGLIAIKEAAVPLLFGLAVVISLLTPKPLVRLFLYNDQIFDVPKVDAELDRRGTHGEFDQLMVFCTRLLAISFIISGGLNFMLASLIVKSPSNTDAFNDELARMNLLSWPVILLPSLGIMMFALFKLIKGLKELTGYEFEDVMHAHLVEEQKLGKDGAADTSE